MNENALDNSMDRLEQRVTEACDSLWSQFVDPAEAYVDDEGVWWNVISHEGAPQQNRSVPFATNEQLAEIRQQSRRLVATNEYAINGVENRTSYVVGVGHNYRACIRKGASAVDDLELRVQELIDEFIEVNSWKSRQQETLRRMDRDGEALLRFFVDPSGMTHVRFVEPEQLQTPRELANYPAASFGIQTEPDDVETVVAYFIDGQPVEADAIQHRKANVDRNVKRGLPLYYPVRKNLRRIEKLLRNMSVVSEIQSAIALIRKHRGATRTGVEQFVAAGTDRTNVDPLTGRTRRLAQYAPGTILDAPEGTEYDFPAQGIDASSFVTVLHAELRAIASRLVMPEYMFTSNASNSNYASTLVAEGPAIKMFERLQACIVEDDRRVMWRVIDNAAAHGRLPAEARRLVDLQITPPTLRVREQLKDAQVEKIAYDSGLISPQTWSLRLGLDYDQEQKNLKMHEERERQ